MRLFSNETIKENISSITTGDSLVVFKQFDSSNLIFIGRSKTLNVKKLEKLLEQIYIKFSKQYSSEIIEKFDGNVSIFNDFKETIDKLFK